MALLFPFLLLLFILSIFGLRSLLLLFIFLVFGLSRANRALRVLRRNRLFANSLLHLESCFGFQVLFFVRRHFRSVNALDPFALLEEIGHFLAVRELLL